jgi:RNA polymerase sigma-70 factor (ECF subfamily)
MSSSGAHDQLARWTEAAARGDRAALEALLVSHLPRLRAFVRLRAGQAARAHEDSSDLVQSVCREILLRADQFRFPSESAFRNWLYTLTLRKIGKRVRHHGAAKRDAGLVRARPASDAAGATELSIADCYASFTTPSADLEARERMEQVEAAFDHLTEEQREIVTLAYLVGLSRQEIAAQLGKSEGAVRATLHRALVRISERLDKKPLD